jgi:hypothetical protein
VPRLDRKLLPSGRDEVPALWSRHETSALVPSNEAQRLASVSLSRSRGIFNVYSGTVFEGRHFTPEKTVLFVQGVLQGKPTAQLARELRISRTTATEVRHQLQASTRQAQPQTPLSDLEVETDEMFQNPGEKGV